VNFRLTGRFELSPDSGIGVSIQGRHIGKFATRLLFLKDIILFGLTGMQVALFRV
jgi:hypothetical protein